MIQRSTSVPQAVPPLRRPSPVRCELRLEQERSVARINETPFLAGAAVCRGEVDIRPIATEALHSRIDFLAGAEPLPHCWSRSSFPNWNGYARSIHLHHCPAPRPRGIIDVILERDVATVKECEVPYIGSGTAAPVNESIGGGTGEGYKLLVQQS